MNFERFFKKAEDKGLEAVQVYFDHSVQLDLEVFKGELDKHQLADSKTLTIQGIYQGKMGKMTTEVIDFNEEDSWVDTIIKSASLIESNDQVFIYEGDKNYRDIPGLYNNELESMDVQDKIEKVFKLDALMREKDTRIDISQVYYGQTKKHVIIQNSKGLNLEKKLNNAFLYGYVVARENDDSRTGLDYVQSNDVNDFDLESIAAKAVNKAVSLLGAKPVKSGNYEILLENGASASLLSAYVGMFSAESVQKGMSKLASKLGENIADEKITIVDDPFMPKSPRSGGFDDEGVAASYKELVSNGTLTQFMHNLKTAHKADSQSTGNGFKGNVAPTNFYIKPGNKAFNDALKSMKKGLLITDLQGTHSGTNPISGDFSLQAGGYLIENGEIVKPVALITVAGNYLTMLQEVTEICDDLKMGFSFIGSPSLKIKSLVVSGE